MVGDKTVDLILWALLLSGRSGYGTDLSGGEVCDNGVYDNMLTDGSSKGNRSASGKDPELYG